MVQRRVQLLEDEGIVFHTGIEVGKEVKGEEILKDHDAMLLALGSTWPRDLPIPGNGKQPIKGQ